MFYFQKAILLLVLVFGAILLKAQSSAPAIMSANIIVTDDQPVIENISINNSTVQKKNTTELNIASVTISGNNYIYSIITPGSFIIKSNQNEEEFTMDLSNNFSNNNSFSNNNNDNLKTALKEWFLSARTKIPMPAGKYFSTSAVEVIINYN